VTTIKEQVRTKASRTLVHGLVKPKGQPVLDLGQASSYNHVRSGRNTQLVFTSDGNVNYKQWKSRSHKGFWVL
jgi:hypothetical protein